MTTLFTPEEAAERLRVPASTIRSWARAELVDHVRAGKRRILFTEKQIDGLVSFRTVKAKPVAQVTVLPAGVSARSRRRVS